jgi:hypothetical protein
MRRGETGELIFSTLVSVEFAVIAENAMKKLY